MTLEPSGERILKNIPSRIIFRATSHNAIQAEFQAHVAQDAYYNYTIHLSREPTAEGIDVHLAFRKTIRNQPNHFMQFGRFMRSGADTYQTGGKFQQYGPSAKELFDQDRPRKDWIGEIVRQAISKFELHEPDHDEHQEEFDHLIRTIKDRYRIR